MRRIALLFFCMSLAACGANSPGVEEEVTTLPPAPDLIANNAFYYYNDVNAAWEFYRDTLGFETVVDYGFAKIMRVAETSYLTLVQADSGMHTAEEPKTVVLRLITDGDYELPDTPNLIEQVAVLKSGQTEIVVQDPGGYRLTFTKLDAEDDSGPYAAMIAELQPLSIAVSGGGIRAAIYSIYMHDLATAQPFYAKLLDRDAKAVPGGGALFYVAGSGFLNLVDGSDHLYEATEESGVTISFFTTDVDAWFERASITPGFELRTPEVFDESGMVRVFVGYDPEGNFLEWDTFLDLQENADLMKYLN